MQYNGLHNIGTSKFGVLGHLGSLPVTIYGFLFVIGFIIAVVFAAMKLRYFYKVSYDPILSFAVVVFPFGIVCASIWSYLIGNSDHWYSGFTGTGGLAIQGGVTMGALLGIFWFPIVLRKNKYRVNIPFGKAAEYDVIKRVSSWVYFDAIIPVILLGQAIGRWGNFFNYEVFGQTLGNNITYHQAMDAISRGDLSVVPMNWLRHAMPGVWYNMWIASDVVNSGTVAAPSMDWQNAAHFHQPLFLYESFFNIMWFSLIFILPHFVPKYKSGIVGSLAIIYTGVFREITEPMRYRANGFGFSFSQSEVFSALLITIGLLIIVFAIISGHKYARHFLTMEYLIDHIKIKFYHNLKLRKFAYTFSHKIDSYFRTTLTNKVQADVDKLSKVSQINFQDYIIDDKQTKYYGSRWIQIKNHKIWVQG